MSKQVNLHSHTEGSFLDGEARIGEVVDRAVALGQEYIAVTDHGECNQHLAGARAAAKAGIGFIPGIEGYWMFPEQIAWHRAQKGKLRRPHPSHICLLAMTDQGLRNLWTLSTLAYTGPQFDHDPIMTPAMLSEYAEGISVSDGCMLTHFADAVDQGDEDKARQILGTLLGIFKERFYMELHTWQYMNDDRPEHLALNAKMRRLNAAKVRFATELGVPLVVVNDSHHADPSKWLNRELVWAFNTSRTTDKLQASLQMMAQKADHLMGDDELYLWMGKHGIGPDVVAEAIKNSYDIASRCKVQLTTPTLSLPRLARDEADDLRDLLRACQEGFRRYVVDEGLDEARYMARLEEELRLIAAKNFAGYFNIVRDSAIAFRSGSWAQYVKRGADKEPLLLGPGRGSAGGCLVAYLTNITQIDPIKYGTLFSRFLSPGRKGLPDIDMDVPQSQRPLVLAYLRKRYGEEHVCAIGTLNRNGPKQTLRDLGRALKIPQTDINAMSDHIEEVERLRDPTDPDAEELTYGDLIERKRHQLAPFAQKYEGLFQKMGQLTGLIRHSGVHASGILISADPILGRIPLRDSKTKGKTTQLDMHDVELLGGVKFDWLGLRHLDTIAHARQLIYERHGLWIDFDRTGLSVPRGCTRVLTFGDEQFNDPDIWPAIGTGRTLGIFQLESSFATATALEFKPRSPVDVADLTAIIRPGVSDAGLKEVYLRRRAGQEPVVYDHPLMERIVGPKWATNTYGVLVYQEQLIECVQQLASFTADEADDLRKAVGKKQMDKLKALKDKFLDGCLNNPDFREYFRSSATTTVAAKACAEKIWDSIEASGRYAFNWSHAVEYGAFIATWEIWLKHHYPQEFLVALMATDSGSINRYIREARRRGITILPPDINKSDRKFSIEDEAVRYGLDTVRGVGPAACTGIMAGRPYASIEDYLNRSRDGSDKGAVYNLILIGAFDEMGTRPEMLERLRRWRARKGLAESTLVDDEKLQKVINRRLASDNAEYRVDVPDFADRSVMYEIEKLLVGTFITVDPLERYLDVLETLALRDPLDMTTYPRGKSFIVGGLLTKISPTVTKRGQTPGAVMAHLTVNWNEAEFRVVAFPEAWARTKLLFTEGRPVAMGVKKLENGCCLNEVIQLDHLFDREGL